MMPAAITRPLGIREGFAAKSSWAGVESEDKFRTAWKSDEGAIPSAEEADRAWNASLVPASITRPHGTGRVLDAESCREGVESEEKSSGCGERGWGSFSKL
jgi:hypothetical protein